MKNKDLNRNEWGKFYDNLAKKGDDELFATARCSLNTRKVVGRIVNDVNQKLNLTPNDVFLDIGCGTGVVSTSLWQQAGKSVGLDYGKEVLIRARKNFKDIGDDVDYAQGDITSLPFRSESFSKVLCYSVVMYLPNYDEFKQALVEMLRVCRHGGLVMVGDIPEKKKKEEWIKGARRQGEPLLRYLVRKLRRKITQARYRNSIRQFAKMQKELDITPPEASGMAYDADMIMRICGEIGVKSTILDQPSSLTFGNTRVDLLLEKE